MYPHGESAQKLCGELSAKYRVPVMAVNCLELREQEIKEIITQILFEFPVKEIGICYPAWINALDLSHPLKSEIISSVKSAAENIRHIRDVKKFPAAFKESQNVDYVSVEMVDLGKGSAKVMLNVKPSLFCKIRGASTVSPGFPPRQASNRSKDGAEPAVLQTKRSRFGSRPQARRVQQRSVRRSGL